VAADHDTDETALVSGFEYGFVALVGGKPGFDDDFIDLVGREALEQANLFKKKTFQVNFTHAVLA
jgi:hypothetical protein